MKVAGLDLAGSPKRDTGVCILGSLNSPGGRAVAKTAILHDDVEILDFVSLHRPDMVAIDAPLFLPAEPVLKTATARTSGTATLSFDGGESGSFRLRLVPCVCSPSGRLVLQAESGRWISRFLKHFQGLSMMCLVPRERASGR